MTKFLLWILITSSVVGTAYFFAPDRIRDQMSATVGFLGSSFGKVFVVAADTVSEAKKFVVEQADETKKKAEDVVSPPSPSKKREALLNNLETTISKLGGPESLTSDEVQKIAEEAKVIIAEVKENNEDNKGFLSSIIGTVTSSDKAACRIEGN